MTNKILGVDEFPKTPWTDALDDVAAGRATLTKVTWPNWWEPDHMAHATYYVGLVYPDGRVAILLPLYSATNRADALCKPENFGELSREVVEYNQSRQSMTAKLGLRREPATGGNLFEMPAGHRVRSIPFTSKPKPKDSGIGHDLAEDVNREIGGAK